MIKRLLLICCVALMPMSGWVAAQDSSLSEKEIHQLLQGKGMGMAKVAELNGYPGPKHVLELKEALNLTPEQEAQSQLLFSTMYSKASQLGQKLVAIETEMEAAFAAGVDKPGEFRKLVKQSAKLRGQIRLAHIEAHVNQKKLLTADQIAAYTELRQQAKGGHQGHSTCGKKKMKHSCPAKKGGQCPGKAGGRCPMKQGKAGPEKSQKMNYSTAH